MPEKRGRKRKAVRQRSHGDGPGAAAPQRDITPLVESRPPAAGPNARAALRWRYAGLILALITVMIAVLTTTDALASGYGSVNLAFRLVTGAGLGVLAIAIAAMVLIPDRLRAWIFRE